MKWRGWGRLPMDNIQICFSVSILSHFWCFIFLLQQQQTRTYWVSTLQWVPFRQKYDTWVKSVRMVKMSTWLHLSFGQNWTSCCVKLVLIFKLLLLSIIHSNYFRCLFVNYLIWFTLCICYFLMSWYRSYTYVMALMPAMA